MPIGGDYAGRSDRLLIIRFEILYLVDGDRDRVNDGLDGLGRVVCVKIHELRLDALETAADLHELSDAAARVLGLRSKARKQEAPQDLTASDAILSSDRIDLAREVSVNLQREDMTARSNVNVFGHTLPYNIITVAASALL